MSTDVKDGVHFTLATTHVTILPDQTLSHFANGSRLIACHADVKDVQATTAQELGYPSVEMMNLEHDLYHHLLAVWLDLPESPTLKAAASQLSYPLAHVEEAAVLALQKFAHAQGVNPLLLAQKLQIE